MSPAERRGLIEAYAQGYSQVAQALEAFRAARSNTLPLLEAMSDEDWRREGWHTESGRYTAETWLEIYAAHAHGHAAQIRRLREALGG